MKAHQKGRRHLPVEAGYDSHSLPEGDEGLRTGEPTLSGAEDEKPFIDDSLALYFKQMGSIPRPNRQQELELVARLDRVRGRFRRAALGNWSVLGQVVETFERTRSGELCLDRVIDVVPSLGLTAESIQTRLPHHLEALRLLREEAAVAFKRMLRAGSPHERAELQRALRRLLHRGVRLAEELSPRIEFVDSWAAEQKRASAWVQELLGQMQGPARSAAARAERSKGEKELRYWMVQHQAVPEELDRWVGVLDRRRSRYQQARQELAAANLRLVVSIAKRYRGQGLSFSDLIQEGNSGLMRGLDKFDYRLGWKFGTYVTYWIRQGMTRALGDTSRTVRIPCHWMSRVRELERFQSDYTARYHREPTIEELAGELKITPADVRLLLASGRKPMSLDDHPGEEEDEAFHNLLADREAPSPAEEVDRQFVKERVAELLRCLAPRDREVLELRFGLRDGQPRTLEEIAKVYGITRERIRQIETNCLQKLRKRECWERLSDLPARG
jgi:RNA polymerase primary sigma factor